MVLQTTRDPDHEDCEMVTIGNGCMGISIYPEGKEDKDRLHVSWADIVKISYKRDKFRMIYHPPEVCLGGEGHMGVVLVTWLVSGMQSETSDEDSNGKRPKIKRKFYTGPRPQAKRVWKNAVEQHVFFQ